MAARAAPGVEESERVMGLGLLRSSSFGRCNDDPPSPALGDPNPARFKIVRSFALGEWLAAEIVWPDASNFEGRKVALYRSSLAQLQAAAILDPHFSETPGPLVPIARFVPTEEGWDMALSLMELLTR